MGKDLLGVVVHNVRDGVQGLIGLSVVQVKYSGYSFPYIYFQLPFVEKVMRCHHILLEGGFDVMCSWGLMCNSEIVYTPKL